MRRVQTSIYWPPTAVSCVGSESPLLKSWSSWKCLWYVVGVVSSSKIIGFDENKEGSKISETNKTGTDSEVDGEPGEEKIGRHVSETSIYAIEEDEEGKIRLGPQRTLKEQFEKDKDDERLRRWKEQLLGSVDINSVGVDSTKEMIGTFSTQLEPYTHEMPQETTPSGIFARGSYSAKTKFLDDDNKCYLEINYTFDIRKDWLST